MRQVIKKLQTKSYEEKKTILKIGVIVTVLIVLGLWMLTLKFRTREPANISKFDTFIQKIEELRSKF